MLSEDNVHDFEAIFQEVLMVFDSALDWTDKAF